MDGVTTNVCIILTQESGCNYYSVMPRNKRVEYMTEPVALHVYQNEPAKHFNDKACINLTSKGHRQIGKRDGKKERYKRREEIAIEMELTPHEEDPGMPFFVVPSLDKPQLEGSYTITVISDHEVRLNPATR